MTQVVQAKCPFCQNVLRIPADWLAQPMRCKYCKQVIQAKPPAGTLATPITASAAQANVAVAAPPEAATAVVAGAPPRRSSGDPFSFDEGPEPEPIAAPRRQKKGKGLWIAAGLLVGLSAVAVLVVVFAGPQLRDLFKPKEEPVAQNGGNNKPAENADKVAVATDKIAKPKNVEPSTDKAPEGDGEKPSTDGSPAPKKKSNPGVASKGKEKELFPRRALLINVNNYWVLNPVHYGSSQSPGYPGSSTSVLANRLSNAPMYFPATQVVELSDSASTPLIPSKSVIEDTISEFCNTCRAQDRIIVLFAGHAIEIEKEAYLIPYEGLKDKVETLIPLKWVYDKLAKCKARQKILVLDAFRNPPARGFELPGTGAMSEDFDAKLQAPPDGVQVWSVCIKDQYSMEFDRGSLFLQSLSNAMQERLGGFADPNESIPVEALVPKVNQRMKDMLTKDKIEQVSRLSGKEAEGGAAYDPKEPLPPQVNPKAAEVAVGADKAGGAMINNILGEMKQIPPMKASLKEYMATLKAEAMPPFQKKVMDFYTADYKSWGELETKLKDKTYQEKHPLRAAVLEAKRALDKTETLRMEDRLDGPISDMGKAAFLEKQKEPGLLIFELEEALMMMVEADKDENRTAETNKRWQANFDYTMARLKARLVYIHEYNYILGDIRADRLPVLEGDASGWRLGFKPKLSTNESKVKNMAKDIAKLWKKIGEEHPNTPWALLAQRESLYAMGLEWRTRRD